MKIGIPRETLPGESRVALIPANVSALTRDKHEVLVESGAGNGASISDESFVKSGATTVNIAQVLYQQADVVFKVAPPTMHEVEMMKEGGTYIGFLAPLANADTVHALCKRRVTSFSMEYIPRITRAQSMDALSSMATVAGYKAVLLATEKLGKMFPMLMTAAGTVPAATVLILGAGVAGLQAIATAKRLGAKVEAFDVRAAVKEQIKSLGATFLEMEMTENLETAGGYAKEQSAEFLKKQMEMLSSRMPKVNVVISTAQVFGKRAPILITEDMVKLMHPGSVIVDLAAEQGGNCALTEPGKTVVRHGVTIVGALNLPATIPMDASLMYSKNVLNLFKLLYPKPDAVPDFNDEVVKGACITRNGEIVNDNVRAALQGGNRS
ncbi:MAG: transhydrogenase subunit alpha [Bacteroidetes bacterium]|nr:transhydrogenase subunit alpha [Bacteroidota bacterium]